MSKKPEPDSLLFSDHLNCEPHYLYEKAMMKQGAKYVAGVDEAGRGPLAGPVVAAAVILDADNIPEGLNDSKKLTSNKRQLLFEEILASAKSVSWHSNSAQRIDQINILQASIEAMDKSARRLSIDTQFALFDGRDIPLSFNKNGKAVVKGDATSLSVAAASIVAKTIRDKIMIRYDTFFPSYGFAKHKGYGSKMHMEAIAQYGPCPIHRRSFSPIKDMQE